MKSILFFLLFSTVYSFSQEKVTLDNIAKYEGKTVIVCEKVQSTFLSKSNTTMLNFGKPYPNQTFVVVIKSADLVNFSYEPHELLKDKTICITGIVEIYKGMPQIIVTAEKEMEVQ